MIWVILGAAMLLLALFVKKIATMLGAPSFVGNIARVAFAFIGAFCLFATSFVIIGPDSLGHMKKKYFGTSMEPGQVIALGIQNGKKAEVLQPGFHFSPFLNVIHDIEEKEEMVIRPDNYGLVTAADGLPIEHGEIMSSPWPSEPALIKQMLDANYFLTEGKGQKGVQNVTLPPGTYRYNNYLFNVEEKPVKTVEAGFVSVVKSNIQEIPYDREEVKRYVAEVVRGTTVSLSTPIVPKGYKGVWGEVLTPGKYWMNDIAFDTTDIDVRIKTLKYLGGFKRRIIDLEFDQEGQITQTEREENVERPEGSEDQAILVKIEGWEIPLEVRVQYQVEPKNAPLVVATVGTLEEIENFVVTPALRSIARDVCGEATDPLDLMFNRDKIKSEIDKRLSQEANLYGITIINVQIGEPAIPPELLVASRRQQISSDLLEAYAQEQKAQIQRIEREKAKAEADKQDILIEAQIKKEAAEHMKEQLKLEGEGEKLKLTEIAEGQSAQRDVLGEANVMKLAVLEKLLAEAPTLQKALSELQLPEILILGNEGNGLEGASAILGSALEKSSINMQKVEEKPLTQQ